ncbi:cwf18 pre-mRNA splicing factor-domain-containing protein [Podospora australis]|uniref:Cwf18 pre-mRNA splicing factor-domain-containing protein n=1 Tax=Podospora australis TaxID=1536484 RepID=A0AAN6WZQ2_9PEZI|nr:cwf18 pre-mRNA splicing factor-domain-containing protein [Podospora australis]
MSSHASLSAASDDRKARLAKLKSLKRKQPEPETSYTPEEEDNNHHPSEFTDKNNNNDESAKPPTADVARMHLSGRNYDFETKGPKLGFEAPPTLAVEKPTLEEQAADLEDELRRKAALDAQDDKGIDLFKLQPKKPNWDLKRELNLRMEVLNVRTDNAIARMVRERLAEKKKASLEKSGGSKENKNGAEDAEADGMLDGAAIVEGIKLREREEEEEARREKEAEDEEFGTAPAAS